MRFSIYYQENLILPNINARFENPFFKFWQNMKFCFSDHPLFLGIDEITATKTGTVDETMPF